MAAIVRKTDDEFVLEKPLDDGSQAVGLFNLANTPRVISVDWKGLQLEGKQMVRDVWRQNDVGPFAQEFSATVPPPAAWC